MKSVPSDRQTAILPVAGAGIIAAAPGPLPWAMSPVMAVSLSALRLLARVGG